MTKKNRGFTLFEIMIGLFMSAIIIAAISNLLKKTSTDNTATTLANQTTAFSDVASNYLTTNYLTISQMMKNTNSLVIQWATIGDNSFNSIGNTSSTVYKQIPCVVLIKETNVSGGFTPYLFFVNTATTEKFPANSAALKNQRKLYGEAASMIGASAGQIMQPLNILSGMNGVAYGVNRTWNTINSNIFTPAVITSCGGSDVDNRGVVVNLSFNKKFIPLIDDSSLQKITSSNTDANPNQLTSGVSFAEEYYDPLGTSFIKYHTLVLDKTSSGKNIILASGLSGGSLGVTGNNNQLNLINTGIQAGKIIIPDSLKNELASCKNTEIGKTIPGQITTPKMGVVQTMLTCSNSNSCSASPCYISRFSIRVNSYYCNPTTGSCNPYQNNSKCTLIRPYQAGGCTSYSYTVLSGCSNMDHASCTIGSTYHYPGSCGSNGGYASCDGIVKNGKYFNGQGFVDGGYNCTGAGCAGDNWSCGAYSDEILAQYDCQQ